LRVPKVSPTGSPDSDSTLLSRVFHSQREPLLEDAFATEIARVNHRRLRVLLPVVCVGHAIHVAAFLPSLADRATLTPRVIEWRQAIAGAHAATLPVALLLAAHCLTRPQNRPSRWLATAVAFTYLMHAAVVVSIDQLTVTSVTPFIGYCLGIAGVLVLSPLAAVTVYALGLSVYAAGVLTFQALPEVRLAVLPNGISIAVLGAALSILFHAARRREFVQLRTIERQREQLEEMNASLEQRVTSQVGEILARASEVEALNTQLRAQVTERSRELSLALAKLSRQDGDVRVKRGTLLGGRFEIYRFIGEGGMGSVYSGVDRATGGDVAIKIVQASSSRQVAALERFLREARSAAAVNHPAVVRMLHVDVSDGVLYQVQELVVGETLDRRIRAGTKWTPGEAARAMSLLSEALAAAHAEGVVHRDVKPANVMLTVEEPGLKLLDFGISKLYQDEEWAAGATVPGTVLGTPAYMSPEQVSGGSFSDRVDVYAVGIILFTLLTGRHPFDDDTSREVLAHQLLTVPPEAASLDATVPPVLSRLVTACLEKDPSLRPSARSLARTLRTFADETGAAALTALARPDTVERTAVEGPRRHERRPARDEALPEVKN
jgi:hypothetical protein